MRKLSVLMLLICLTVMHISAQTIQGIVKDNGNNPLIGVSVMVKGSTNGTVTNIDGQFQLEQVSKNQMLVLSYIGFKTQEVKIPATNKQLKITLYEGNELLQGVTISAERTNRFSRKATSYVAKLPLKDLENSQVYTTITSDLLQSQAVSTFAEALDNAAGVNQLWSSTGRSGDGAGYYTMRGFSVQPQLVNGVAGITNGFINPSYIERIEIIKGPSATLFGNMVSSYGGLINIVTKKPTQETGGNVELGSGSYGYQKAAIDVNYSEPKNHKFSARLNAGYQNQDSWQDAGFARSLFIAPSLSYKVNNKLTFNLSYTYTENKQTNAVFLFMNRSATLNFHNVEELNYDYNKSMTSDDINIKNPTKNIRGEAVYKLSKNWTSQTLISGNIAKSTGYYSYLWNSADYSTGAPVATDNFSLLIQDTDSKTTSYDIQENVTGDFKIGTMRNRVVIGADFLAYQLADNGSSYAPAAIFNAQGDFVNGTTINKSVVDAALANASYSNTDTRQNFLGVYVSDVINVTRDLSFMAGLRFDQFNYRGDRNDSSDDKKEYTKHTFSPKLGIVYQPIYKKLSVFANYQNSFNYVNPELLNIDDTDPSLGKKLNSYDLERANQVEVGVKTNLFSNRLNATVSLYNIQVANKVMGYGASKVQDGTVESRGVEIDINANPIQGLNLKAGYSYNHSELKKSTLYAALVGLRYGESGPKTSYNFWADYHFSKDNFLKNFGLGFGFNGVSSFDTMASYPTSGGFKLPAYCLFNSVVYYDNQTFRISLKGNNLGNKKYYTGWTTVTPHAPHSLLVNLMYRF